MKTIKIESVKAGQIILTKNGQTIAVNDIREEDDLVHINDVFGFYHVFYSGHQCVVIK